jgi:CheY-like chemotaxis protein
MLHLRALLARARSAAANARSARALPASPAPLSSLPAPPAAAAPGVSAGALHLLLVSREAAQAAALHRIAAELGWTFALASSAAEAAALPPAGPTVIVFDRDLPGEDWRRALPRLAALPHTACVLLASAVADEYLWQEVSRHGGDDLLAKPWKSAEVRRVAAFAAAWRAWTGRT